jgi:hypothetical protein
MPQKSLHLEVVYSRPQKSERGLSSLIAIYTTGLQAIKTGTRVWFSNCQTQTVFAVKPVVGLAEKS